MGTRTSSRPRSYSREEAEAALNDARFAAGFIDAFEVRQKRPAARKAAPKPPRGKS